jgi:hypothetical protein
VPVVFGVVAAFMSLFSSTLGVVTPALFPMVLPIAQALGLEPMVLFIAIVVGAESRLAVPAAVVQGRADRFRRRAGVQRAADVRLLGRYQALKNRSQAAVF